MTAKRTPKQPELRWHDNGNSFMCMRCGTVIQRMNPYPGHECDTPSPYDLSECQGLGAKRG